MTVGIWKGAITGQDNETMDPPMFIGVVVCLVMLPLLLVSLVGLAYVDVLINKHEAQFAALGGGITAILIGISGFVGAIVALIWQDRKERAAQTVKTTQITEVTPAPITEPAKP